MVARGENSRIGTTGNSSAPMRQFTSLIYTRTLFGKEDWYKDRNKKEGTSEGFGLNMES